MNTTIVAEVLKYDISERILIVEDIWDSIAQEAQKGACTTFGVFSE